MIVGLGNPGREYEGSKHNAGFAVVDELARKWDVSLWKSQMEALVASVKGDGETALVGKPQT